MRPRSHRRDATDARPFRGAAALAGLLLLAAPSTAQPPPPPHVVNVACCAFADSQNGTNVTIVKQGTTVLWLRTDMLSHTVTSGTGPLDPNSGALFNGSLIPPSTSFSHTFTT